MASIFDEDAPVEVVPTAPLVTGASPAPAAAAPAPTAVVPSARSADIFAGDAPIAVATAPAAVEAGQGGPWYRVPEVFAGGMARGALGLPGVPGNIEALGRAGLNYLFAGVSPEPYLPTSQSFVSGAEGLPVVGPALAATEPRTRGERYWSRAGEFVGGTAPTLFLGGTPTLANVLSQSARAAGAGVGAEFARELYPTHPIATSLAGALLGQTGTGLALGAGSRLGAAAGLTPTASTPLTQAYEAAGITPRLAGDVTQSSLWQVGQRVAGTLPGGGQVARAGEQTVGEFGNSVENTASKLAPAVSKIETGGAVQKAGEDWLNNWKANEKSAWNNVNVPDDAPVDMSGVMSTLQARLGTYPGAPRLAASQGNAELRQLHDDLTSDIGDSGTLQWQAAKNLRSDIGAKIGSGAWSPDRDLAALNAVHGQLTDALGATAAAHDAEDAWQTARAVTKEGHDFLDNGLRSILNANPEGAVDQAMRGVKRGGGSLLTDLRAQMPNAVDQLGGYQLRQMALAPPSRQNATGTAISPSSYLTGRTSLSPEASAALFGRPDVAADLNNLDQVAGSMRATYERLPNPSGTGAMVMHAVPWTAIPTGAVTGFVHSGLPGGLAGAATGAATIAPGLALANILARPAGTRLLLGPAERGRFNVPGYAVGGVLGPYLAQ